MDIVVLNYNDAKTTIEFCKKHACYETVDHVLIVDNCSNDNSVEQMEEILSNKVELVVSSKNVGYGAGNNLGIKTLYEKYHSKYILLSNPDVIVEETVLKKMVNFLCNNDEYAIVAPFMLNAKKEKQYNTAFRIPEKNEYILSLGILFSKLTKSFYYDNILDIKDEVMTVGSVSGSMFLMDAERMIKYGMYDENIFLYCEEVTLGLRLQQAGQKVALLPQETFIHNHSVSISKSYKSEVSKRKLLLKSKLYVIKNYYKAKGLQYLIAIILSKICIFETWILSIFRRNK